MEEVPRRACRTHHTADVELSRFDSYGLGKACEFENGG